MKFSIMKKAATGLYKSLIYNMVNFLKTAVKINCFSSFHMV